MLGPSTSHISTLLSFSFTVQNKGGDCQPVSERITKTTTTRPPHLLQSTSSTSSTLSFPFHESPPAHLNNTKTMRPLFPIFFSARRSAPHCCVCDRTTKVTRRPRPSFPPHGPPPRFVFDCCVFPLHSPLYINARAFRWPRRGHKDASSHASTHRPQ